MSDVLLTVSGIIDPSLGEQIAKAARPRADYSAIADACNADLLDYREALAQGGMVGRVLARILGSNAAVAWACWRGRKGYPVIITDGEQVGILLAILLKLLGRGPLNTQHLMIGHVLSVRKKMALMDLFRAHTHIDRFLVYATSQQQFVRNRWHVPKGRVSLTPFMVDAEFFNAAAVEPTRRRMIFSAGLEFRDYATLIEAVRDLDVEVVIAAASPWSKRRDRTRQMELPPNVTVHRFSHLDLRQLYADALFAVVPLYDVDFQAGVTTILEAMAMGRAVICTRTQGQTDVIEDGITGRYVPPGDPKALREAIAELLANPDLADSMGSCGRKVVDERMSLELYAQRFKQWVDQARERGNQGRDR
jgi:glycosyltransferase involved in cell wall biosynthesis